MKIGTMNLILICIGLFAAAFTGVMIILYAKRGGIPDTLCTCVFSALGGECGVMGVIKAFKEKYKGDGKDD